MLRCCLAAALLILLCFAALHCCLAALQCCLALLLQVSVLFADIVGFMSMSKEVEPEVVMEFLNDLYCRCTAQLEA
jgi:hypothetical protein